MPFLKRNYREILWAAANAVFACTCVWLAVVQPGKDPLIDLYVGATCFIVACSCAGYWVWAIFDNADQDALTSPRIEALLAARRKANDRWDASLKDMLSDADPYLDAGIRRRLNGGDGA